MRPPGCEVVQVLSRSNGVLNSFSRVWISAAALGSDISLTGAEWYELYRGWLHYALDRFWSSGQFLVC